jgi:hypothetical protein
MMSGANIQKQSRWLLAPFMTILLLGSVFIHAYDLWPFAHREAPVSDTKLHILGRMQCGAVAIGACTSYYNGGIYEGYCPATALVIRPHTLLLARAERRVCNITLNVGSQSCSLVLELPK